MKRPVRFSAITALAILAMQTFAMFDHPLVQQAQAAGPLDWFASSGSVQIWAVPDSTVLFPQAPPEIENDVYTHATRTVRLEAAINEVVSFQLAVRGESGKPEVTGITLDDFVQQGRRIPASQQVRLYRELRVPVTNYPTWYLRLTPYLREPREFPDILVPLSAPRGGLPMPVAVGQCEAIWIDITIPIGTDAGLYHSTLTVSIRGNQPQRLPITLTVLPFSLPQQHHLPVIAGVDSKRLIQQHVEVAGRPYSPQQWSPDDPAYPKAVQVIHDTFRLLHDHRCSAMLTDLQPSRQLDMAGQLTLDWKTYDQLITPALDGSAFDDRVAVSAWPMPINDRDPDPQLHGGWGSAAHSRMLVDYLRLCTNYFREHGWFDRHFVNLMPPTDGPAASAYSKLAWLGSTLMKADPQLTLLCQLPPQSMKPFGAVDDVFQDLSSWVSIWAPLASFADADAFTAVRQAGKHVWLQPDRPPYSGSLSIIAPPVFARSLAWQAYRMNCSALFLPQITRWTDDGGIQPADSANALIWPGKPYGLSSSVPSIRLKRMRRGLQDYEYLWLLERNQRPAIAELISADLFAFGGTGCFGEHLLDSRPNGWANDPSAWELARSLMARQLTAAMTIADQAEIVATQPTSQPTPSKTEPFDLAQRVDWQRHVEKVRRVYSLVEGVRVRLDPKQPERPLAIRTTISTFNATRQPYTGTLGFAALPEDWRVDARPNAQVAFIEQLRPTQTTYRELEAFAPSIASNVDGVMNLKLHIAANNTDGPRDANDAHHADRTNNAKSFDLPARLCVLTAPRLSRPIVLDGKLDEWPIATNNAAGDFLLVGAQDVPKIGRPTPDRPTLSTFVFVGYDDQALYVAFNCQDDRLDQRVVAQSNQIRYDDLWPTGEDVIEIVLDPTGNAVMPSDLLHIVVKANGAVITERGAPCLKAIGGYGDWPSGVTAAVDDRSQPGRWMAEIRIPLASLGPRVPVWGINFARYVARLGEYSTWSGSRRYLYSPMSLGNIQLTTPPTK